MLSSMHNDLIGEFESYGTAQDMWIALKAKFGGTMVTQLRALTLKFNTFRMQRGDSMQEHLRKMSAMVRELKAAGNNLIDEQQIQAVIRSLPDSWEQMKLNMTHNESIQTLRTCHVILSLRQSAVWRKDRVLPSLLDMASARHLRPSAKVMKKHPSEVRMEENPKREPIPPSAQGASVVDGNKLNKRVLTVE